METKNDIKSMMMNDIGTSIADDAKSIAMDVLNIQDDKNTPIAMTPAMLEVLVTQIMEKVNDRFVELLGIFVDYLCKN